MMFHSHTLSLLLSQFQVPRRLIVPAWARQTHPVGRITSLLIYLGHKLGGLSNRNSTSHSSGGDKSKITVSVGLVLLVAWGTLWFSLVSAASPQSQSSFPLGVPSVCMFVSKFLFLLD